MCQHQPPCPPADAPDREAAHVVASHPEQGWSLLCNGVVMFEDTGALLPDGRSIPPHRPAHLRMTARLPRLRRPPRPCQWSRHYPRQAGHTLRTSLQAMAYTPPPSGETEVRTSRPGTERKDLR